MYGMVFEMNPAAPLLLFILQLDPHEFGRPRDVKVTNKIGENGEKREPMIAVYTRCGGNNREQYQSVFEAIAKHPNYIDAVDDKFDSTYCTFYFKVPEEFKDVVDPMVEDWSGDETWKTALENIANGKATERQQNGFEILIANLMAAIEDRNK